MIRPSRALALGLSVGLLMGAATRLDAQTAGSRHVPTIDELINLPTISGASISPDGRYIAYLRSAADLETDAFVAQVWMIDTATGHAVQMTRGTASASDLHWSPDGRYLTFVSSRHEKIGQIFAIRPDGAR